MIRPVLKALTALAVVGFGFPAAAQTQPWPKSQSRAVDKPVSTPEYVQKAAIGTLFELESSKLALQKSSSSRIRDFAQMMVDEHGKAAEQFRNALAQQPAGVAPPTALDETRAKMLEELKQADGAEFDRKYWDMQLAGHQQALALQRNYAENGAQPALKKFAAEAVRMVEKHLAKLRQRA